MTRPGRPGEPRRSLQQQRSNFLNASQKPVPMGNDSFTTALSGAFATGDGLINIAANKQEQFEALVALVCVR